MARTKAKSGDTPRKEAEEIKIHAERIERVEKGLHFILYEVSANGRPGIENSLRDIYAEVKAVRASVDVVLDATETSRAWSDVRRALRGIMRKSALASILANKVGRTIVFVLVLLIVNSLLHAIGVSLDVLSLLRTFRVIP